MIFFDIFKTSEAEILRNKKTGVIYVADFLEEKGKYISIAEYEGGGAPDVDIKISPKIHLRITYLTSSEKICGVEVAKDDGKKIEKIHFSTLGFERILQLLHLFSELDFKSIANKTVVLEESIIGDSVEVTRFLNLIASDPQGRKKLGEVAKNYGLIEVGDIDNIVQRKEAVMLFEKILNCEKEFSKFKAEIGTKKDEEVWQRFFTKNSWILGSDFVEILDERRIDVENIVDYLLRSFDGFVDIVELKLPTAPFWTKENIPKSELTSASMQCNRYILQVEKEMDSKEFAKRIKDTPIVKPRITLIYGRSESWSAVQKELYRVLNSSYTNLSIITYDHLLERAKRLIGISKTEGGNESAETIRPEDLPF